MNKKLAPFIHAKADVNFKSRDNTRESIRIYILPLVTIAIFCIFAIRLFHLTLVKGAYYRFTSENNRLKEIPIEGKRGAIFDRKGIQIAFSENEKGDFKRKYPNGEALGHVLGYRQIASKENLKDDACKEPLELNDKVGVKGVEKLFECILRPIKGKRLIEVNAHGKPIKTVSKVDPKPGKDITLSIDATLQQRAYDLISQNIPKSNEEINYPQKKISIVALKPNTGEVLLLLSYPSYDPQVFENGEKEKIAQYLSDKEKPLYNRALLGTYPPGSVFKPVIAAAALEEKVISPTDTIEDTGFIEAGPQKFRNWYFLQYGKTDGNVDMIKALQRSNDIYFYRLGEKLGVNNIRDWASNFGFGAHSGLKFDDSTGLIPSDFWKKERVGEKWYLGDTYNLSIGQGYMLTTPMQIARATAVFAQNGNLCTPQIEKSNDKTTPLCTNIGLSDKTIEAIRQGMKKACETGGTGWPFFTFDPITKGSRIDVGCKTGTAQSHLVSGIPHAWFTIFAPFENPEIVLTVLVEESGEGSSIAAPLAKEILTSYFQNNR